MIILPVTGEACPRTAHRLLREKHLSPMTPPREGCAEIRRNYPITQLPNYPIIQLSNSRYSRLLTARGIPRRGLRTDPWNLIRFKPAKGERDVNVQRSLSQLDKNLRRRFIGCP